MGPLSRWLRRPRNEAVSKPHDHVVSRRSLALAPQPPRVGTNVGVMPATRVLPTEEATALLELTRDIATRELLPQAAEAEATETFPRELFRTLGRASLLGLPYPEEYGGGGQPYEVYLQVLEELARRWLAMAEAVSVHTLACYPTAAYGSAAQRERFLPGMLGGELLGAYCLSEP